MKKIKLFLITLLCMVGVMNVSAQDKINSATESASYRSYWNWKHETIEPYSRYKIVNAQKTTNNGNNICAVDKRGNIVSAFGNADFFYFYNKSQLKTGNYIFGNLLNNTHEIIPETGGNAVTATISIGSWDLAARHMYIKNNKVGYDTGLHIRDDYDKSSYIWNFYSEYQIKCFEDYQAARERMLSIPEDKRNEEINAFINPETPFTGETQENRQKVYNRIAKMSYWYNTLMGYGENVPVDMSHVVQYGQGEGANAALQKQLHGWNFTDVATENGWNNANFNCFITSHESNDGVDGDAYDSYYEVKNAKLTQTITGLPVGVYEVSMKWQASPASGYSYHASVKLDATSNGETVTTGTQLGVGVNWAVAATTPIKVTNGELTIEVTALTGDASQQTDNMPWTNFDDVKLTYLYKYKEEPAETFTEQTKKLVGIVEASDNHLLYATDDKPYLDLTDVYAFEGTVFNTTSAECNPNGLCYANEGEIGGNNIIVGDEDDMTCESLILKNGHPYSTRWEFDAEDAKYDMVSFGTGKDDTYETEGKEVTYGTMILPYNVSLSGRTDVKVYTATGLEESGHVTLAEVDEVIANTPYLVKYEGSSNPLFEAYSQNQTLSIESGDNMIQPSGNLLAGAYKEHSIPSDGCCYVLQKQNGRLAFYRVARNDLKISPFRCYIKFSEPLNRNMVSIVFNGDTDGIENIENVNCSDVIYDLQGRSVENLSAPGVYVKNGKKFLVK